MRTTARTAGFMPAASPPLVSTAKLVGRWGVLSMGHASLWMEVMLEPGGPVQ